MNYLQFVYEHWLLTMLFLACLSGVITACRK